jgi:S-DNA-T family DNA segregation ATPase FtsK/SpoIIIE
LELSNYKFPTLDILEDHNSGNAEVSNEELIANKNKIVETLRHYKIEITKIRATIGPTITLYEIVPAPGIRIAKIKNLEDDIALSLAALGIRIIAPIPGRGTIGIEVPNQNPEVVSMRSILSSRKFQESTADLPIALGKTISNETYMFDLTKMPHILVAGATGQGKSVGINVIIASLLYKKHPSQLKFVFIDPKKVELNLYSVLEKHYLAKLPNDDEPVITDIQKVKYTLNSLNVEMDQRYDLLKKAHARNVKEYNKKFISRRLNPEKGHRFMPYIVVVIDEFADLIMTAGKEIELPIARIAQLARAVGIHMIIATQRPSTNIITGVIKANFPARIAFKVASMIDSRTILDTPGANQLIGKGDMLIAQGSNMTRVQCAFIDTPEVEQLCSFISEQQGFPSAFMLPEYVSEEEAGPGEVDLNNRDELFDDAARVVVMNQMGSTSMIQRKFSIGYNRAGRIMDQLEAAGVVGPSEGSKARQVLIQDEYSLEQLLNSLN